MVQQWLSPDTKDKNPVTVHFTRLDASTVLTPGAGVKEDSAAGLQCMLEFLKHRF